jgi:hypothetical protein
MPTQEVPYWATFTPDNIPTAELYRQLDTDQTADFLNVPKRNLEMMRSQGTGPLFIRVGRRAVRYRLLDLIRYQEKQLRQNVHQERRAEAV